VTRLVTDASAIVDLLAGAPNAPAVAKVLAPFPEIDVPEHFHVEAISALRGMLLRGHIAADHAERALQLLLELRVVRHPVEPLARSVWSMRSTLTAYDAAYLAVAQNVNAQLLTTDRGLAAVARQDHRLIEIRRG
jgi:predicted nucleic acid-binding protein